MVLDNVFIETVKKAVKRGGLTKRAKKWEIPITTLRDIIIRKKPGDTITDATAGKIIPNLDDQFFPDGYTKEKWMKEKQAGLLIALTEEKQESPDTAKSDSEKMILKYYRTLSKIDQQQVVSYVIDKVKRDIGKVTYDTEPAEILMVAED